MLSAAENASPCNQEFGPGQAEHLDTCNTFFNASSSQGIFPLAEFRHAQGPSDPLIPREATDAQSDTSLNIGQGASAVDPQ
jgi:hypothetical protein